MNKSDKYIHWLKENVKASSLDCVEIYIFGSVAKFKSNPRDCDLLIITMYFPYTENWKRLCEWRINTKNLFKEKFNLDLNILIINIHEYNEDVPVLNRIKSGEKIIIK